MPLDGLGHDGVKDAASIVTARNLLKKIKRHSDPVLRHYGWTVKHLQESVGGPGGMCFHDGQGTADITLQLRERPSKQCNTFRPFGRLMGVMIHEMTHIAGLGLEDIHPPEFYEKMKEVRLVYRKLLDEGAIEASDDDDDAEDVGAVEGGCRTRKRSGARGKRKRPGAAGATGAVGGASSSSAAAGKRIPRGKKKSLVDRRYKEGKRIAAEQAARTPAENARLAALARFGQAPLSANEQAVKRLRTLGADSSAAIELSSDDDDGGGAGGLLGEIDDGGTTEEETDDDDDDDVELHNGPPGLCDCGICKIAPRETVCGEVR